MSYEGNCLCGNVKFSFEYDPMMHFQCHCTMCQRAFGTTSNALVLPEDELTIDGELKRYSMTGGSGNGYHFNFCPNCGVTIYGKPDLLDGLIYVPAGLLHDKIPFKPTVELWTDDKAKWLKQAETIENSFVDNGTVERLGELLENLDQRE